MIGDKIKELRDSRKWSQRDLAERAGITQAMVASYETHKSDPKRKVLERLAETFQIPVDELVEAKAVEHKTTQVSQQEFERVLKKGINELKDPTSQYLITSMMERLLIIEDLKKMIKA